MIVLLVALLFVWSAQLRTVLQDVFAALSLALFDNVAAVMAIVLSLAVLISVWRAAPSKVQASFLASPRQVRLAGFLTVAVCATAAEQAAPGPSFMEDERVRTAIAQFDALPMFYLEDAWRYMLDNFTDWQIVTLGTFIIHETVYFGAHIPWALCDLLPFMNRYKIQREEKVTWPQVFNCLKVLLFNHLFVQVPMILLAHKGLAMMGFVHTLPLPPLSTVCWQIFAFFVIEDFYFYWIHRFLHWKKIYKHIHKIHHLHAAPFGITAEYAHPVETVFLGIGTALGPLIFARHLFTLWAWLIVRLLETIEDHSGYDLPWNPTNLIPFWGGAVHHDFHHKEFNCNYADIFTIWDRIFGTDGPFRKAQAEKLVNQQSSWSDLWYKLGLVSLPADSGKKRS